MTDKETILITGAAGFIGGWLVERLCSNSSVNVRAGVRNQSSVGRLTRFPVELLSCDVMSKEQIAQAMTGATMVIHCATGLQDVIIQGTKNMLEAALKLGVKRFVYLSTTEVYGNVSGEIDEQFPYQYTGSEYADSKIEAEKLCWKFYERGLPLTVIRPSIVYGPFSKDWTFRVARRLQSGNWGIFEGYGEGICNLVYVDDVVSGILLALRHQDAVGEAFNLNGPEMTTWNQYFQRLNTALGLPELKMINPSSSRLRAMIIKPIKSVAKFMLNYLENPLQKMGRRVGPIRKLMQFGEKSITSTAGLAELNSYNRKAVYLSSKAQQVLGYNPKFDVNAGLQPSVDWINHLEPVN